MRHSVPARRRAVLALGVLVPALLAGCRSGPATAPAPAIPRTADGRPNLQGIWQARTAADVDLLDHSATLDGRPGLGVVEGGTIPYQEWAVARVAQHAAQRATADPLAKCFMPGVPRIMYMPWPFHIFQTADHVAITFEWSQVHRLIYTNGSKPHEGIEFWMGDSRGRWEGDTLVVDVTNHNDRTWFDRAGNFHSEALHLVERYTMTDPDTIRYDVTVTDPKVFTKAWTISVPLVRRTDLDRILEYQCQAEVEEANGAFEREPRTWYAGPGASTPAATNPLAATEEPR